MISCLEFKVNGIYKFENEHGHDIFKIIRKISLTSFDIQMLSTTRHAMNLGEWRSNEEPTYVDYSRIYNAPLYKLLSGIG